MKTKSRVVAAALAAAGLLSGCVNWMGRSHAEATSVMQFLYPTDAQHIDEPGIPVLSLPLRVGIAFVPPAHHRQEAMSAEGPTEKSRVELLNRVAAEFHALPYVKDIQIIPSSYLRPGGSFANLQQVKTMFGVDVIALVAYDQTQFTNEGFLSLSYWTIVGAYVVQGEKNDTQTLMEAVVYDIDIRHLLFRAPGTSQIKASATLVNLNEQLQEDSRKGFDQATTQLIANLKTELENFRVRAKEAPDQYRIEHKPGFVGGGSMDGVFVSLLGLLVLVSWVWRRSCEH